MQSIMLLYSNLDIPKHIPAIFLCLKAYYICLGIKMEKWHDAQARQVLRNEVTRLLRQAQHYFEGKVQEWQRNTGYYIVCQNTMFSDGDMVVLVLRARASDDSIKKLAEYYESLQYEEKVMVESQTS